MRLLMLDLEWDTAYSKRQKRFINEIIEFGGVLLDEDLCEIAEYKIMVRSQLSGKLSGRFRRLTHITDEEMRGGEPFGRALKNFGKFARGADAVVTWSNTDLHVLLDNCRSFTGLDKIPFLRAYMDLQPYVQAHLGTGSNNQIALAAAAEALGMDTSGYEFHRAADDARVCAELLRRTFDAEKVEKLITPAANREFYERLLFKNYFIRDIRSRDIDRKEFNFKCETCRCSLVKKESWKNRNHGFAAELYCPDCAQDYIAQASFKRTYDNVIVKRTLRIKPLREPEEEPPEDTQNAVPSDLQEQ